MALDSTRCPPNINSRHNALNSYHRSRHPSFLLSFSFGARAFKSLSSAAPRVTGNLCCRSYILKSVSNNRRLPFLSLPLRAVMLAASREGILFGAAVTADTSRDCTYSITFLSCATSITHMVSLSLFLFFSCVTRVPTYHVLRILLSESR